jgi:hypothetical protein
MAGIERRRIGVELIASFTGAIGLIALTAVVLWRSEIPYPLAELQLAIAFGVLGLIPFLASWRQAIRDTRLPALPNGSPKHQHISGLGVVAFALAVGLIILIAVWAAPGTEGGRGIQASWGVIVVAGLAIFFIVAAFAPNAPDTPTSLRAATRLFGVLMSPIGRLFSVLDSMMVFAIAGAAGASRGTWQTRYFLLGATIVSCAILGYFLEPPWGLIPIAWAFVVAISISRRWAWIEDDRELSMLNRRYTGNHIRVGFEQDLRDEALLSFMSMFFLVPLALRQAQMWSEEAGTPLFQLTHSVTLLDWIGFYGTELAKAVPFVDWAEIYEVAGVAPIEVKTAPARHVVFATRVLVDLVFLAALLQAIGISTRNAKQKELFFKEGVLDRLDPFIEQREFRKLVRRADTGGWEIDTDALHRFPKYDVIRLGELADQDRHPEIYIAARELRRRDGGGDSEDFHDELMRRAIQPRPDGAGIREVLTAIRTAGPTRQPYELSESRKALNSKPSMNELRSEIIRLIAEASDSDERVSAIVSALVGPDRDSVLSVRRPALVALEQALVRQSPEALACVREVAANDPGPSLRSDARKMMERLGIV